MQSIVANLLANAAARPHAASYVDGGRVVSYRQLAEGVERAAAGLWRRGVRPGELVALDFEEASAESALRSLFLFYGACWLGAAILPLYPEVPAADHEPLMRRYGARRRCGKAELDSAGALAAPPRGDSAERMFLLHFSSGTTGAPRALGFTHGQFAAMIAAGAAADRWSHEDRLLTGRPWPSKVALRYAARLHMVGGALVRARFPRTREELARRIREQGVTAICGAPASMRELLASPAPADGLPALRALRVSGAPTRPDELRALREQITPNVYCSYGSTEVGVIASLRPGEPVTDPVTLRVVTEGLEAEAVDEGDAPVAPGVTGSLRYRARWMPQGYVGNPAASERHFRGGWFYPGDLGSIDAERRITLRGRADDVINFRGVKIVPQEIEGVLIAHPGVADAAVLGVPDELAGQIPVAFVVPRGKIDVPALRRYCAERCGSMRAPVDLIGMRSLPRNAGGKVLREKLLAIYERAVKAAGVPRPGRK